VGFGSLGYLFGSGWELVNSFLSNMSGVVFGVLLLGVGVYFGIRYQRKITLNHK
jgi:membrane protein DedA with SNARE-associated domain